MKEVHLEPIKETDEDYEKFEKVILDLFREEIYYPLLKELNMPKSSIQNSTDDLIEAIRSGRINYYRGQFKGRFNAAVSRELKKIGATWDRTQGSWKIPQSALSIEVRNAIGQSLHKFEKAMRSIDARLGKILPAEIAEKLKIEKLFDSSLWRLDQKIQKSLKGITVTPEFTKDQREKISKEYTENMQLYIKEFTEKEITRLRETVQKSSLKGIRYENIVKQIEKSYGVSANKAKFLARQETSIFMAKVKETRYLDAGVNEYIWGCVAGSPNHPVRPMHLKLKGTRQRFDQPPIVNEKGDRKNPTEDYGCRCFAIPVVKFK